MSTDGSRKRGDPLGFLAKEFPISIPSQGTWTWPGFSTARIETLSGKTDMDKQYADNRLFQGISPAVLAAIDITIDEVNYAAEEIVFEEGDPGSHVYLLLDGQVRISKEVSGGNQETLALVGPGAFFGEMALLDGEVRSARATAAASSVVGRIGRDGLDRFLAHSPETARHFARLISKQLRTANSVFIEKLLQSERLRLLGTMMGAMVHDFRNPLATLGMLGHYLSNEEDATLSDLGQVANDSIEQMQSMIQELLDYSKGQVQLEMGAVEIPELMKKLDDQILRRVEDSGVTVNREIAFDGAFTADSHRLIRLLANIVKNSSEAMSRDGTLTLHVSKHGDSVHFRISDTGCGIPPEVLARVFEPFVTHGKSNGTGLGMAIAKSVVEAHHGHIRMESEVNKGTSTYIEIPLSPPAIDAQETGSESEDD